MKKLLLSLSLVAGLYSISIAANISGNVYNDIDGLSVGGINNLGGTNISGGINVLLVNSSGIVIGLSAVASNGSFLFTGVSAGTDTIRLATGGTLNNAAPGANLPAGWSTTGEGIASMGDGVPDGDIVVTISTSNVIADFGIERTPESAISVATVQNNPGGTSLLTVPASAFATSTVVTDSNSLDYDGGMLASIRIVTFPSSATSLTINGTATYTSANFPSTGVLVPVDSTTNQPTQTIQIDPVDGNLTSILYYVAVDNAGKQDPTASSVSVPVQGSSNIAGRVFNDANSNLAFTSGEGLSGVSVWLFNTDATAPHYLIYPVATAVTDASGNYSFSNIATGNYQIRVRFSTVPTTPTPTPRTVADNNPYTTDNQADGITVLNMSTGITSYSNIDLGLASNVTAPSFISTGSFRWNSANTFNAGQNGQLTGTYNLSPKTFGTNTYTPTITWKQSRIIQPPAYTNQYPQAGYNAAALGVFFPGTNKGGLRTGDTTFGVLAGDFGDYDVYPANNSRTTTGIKFSHPVTNTKFSVYDVDVSDISRRGGRIDHVRVIGYRNLAPVIPVIINPSATPWNTINGNGITGWPDYDINNNSFAYNSGNVDKAGTNVYFSGTIDSIAVEYEEWAPLIVGTKGLQYDNNQMHDSAWYTRVPEGRGIAIGGVDYSALSLSGTVFHDANGISDALINGTAFNLSSTLHAILVDNSGNVAATMPVAADGTYLFPITTGTYTVRLSATAGIVGNVAPAAALPTGWANTGEGLVGSQPSGDGTANGIISVTVTDLDIAGANFGIEQPPLADSKTYTISKYHFANTPASGFPTITGYTAILASNSALTGYAAGGSLTGSDPEDCSTSGSCSAGKSFTLVAFNPNTMVYYDGGSGATQIGSGDNILNFDASKMAIYGQDGTGTGASPVGFTYKLIDVAGITSNAAPYIITTSAPLPVTMLSFTASRVGGSVKLKWITAKETSTSSYDVMRSANGYNFERIGIVSAMGSNSSYAFTDSEPGRDMVYYRLGINSLDGATAVSKVVSVRLGGIEVEDIAIYPNPVRNVLNIRSDNGAAITGLTFTNISGRAISLPISVNGTTDISTLPPGFYLLQVKVEGAETRWFKVNKL